MASLEQDGRRGELRFSRNLRRLLKEKRITLNEIFSISGVAKSVAHGWVNGVTPRDLVAVARLSDALNMSFRELLLGEKERVFATPEKFSKALSEKELFDRLCEIIIERINERNKF